MTIKNPKTKTTQQKIIPKAKAQRWFVRMRIIQRVSPGANQPTGLGSSQKMPQCCLWKAHLIICRRRLRRDCPVQILLVRTTAGASLFWRSRSYGGLILLIMTGAAAGRLRRGKGCSSIEWNLLSTITRIMLSRGRIQTLMIRKTNPLEFEFGILIFIWWCTHCFKGSC